MRRKMIAVLVVALLAAGCASSPGHPAGHHHIAHINGARIAPDQSSPAPNAPPLVVFAAVGCLLNYGSVVFTGKPCTRVQAPSPAQAGQPDSYQLTVKNLSAELQAVPAVWVHFWDAAGNEISFTPVTMSVVQIAPGARVSDVGVGLPAGTASVSASFVPATGPGS